MKKGDIVTGIDFFGNKIKGKYDGFFYYNGKQKGYWIVNFKPSYENCPKENYHKVLHEIKEIIKAN